MCIKTVYHNTYRDGQYDVTERVEACTPGYMCANPLVVEYDREYTIARHEAKALQAKTDRAPFHASPRAPRPSSPSGSGSGSGSSSHHHNNNAPRNRTSGIYAPASSATAAPAATTSTAPRPMPIPIPIRRAATMTYGGMEPPPERGRRPIIVEDRVPRSPRASGRVSASPAPVEVLAHTSSPSRRRSLRHHSQLHHHDPDFDVRRGSSGGLRAGRIPLTVPPPPASNGFLSPQRAADASPQGYGSAEDEQERAERRRRRRAARERASVLPSSLPAFGNTDVFGSSYESAYHGAGGRDEHDGRRHRRSSSSRRTRSGSRHTRNESSTSAASASSAASAAAAASSSSSPAGSMSPAVAAAKKELRWEDEMRRLQNERIRARPKLARDHVSSEARSSSGGDKLQGEVKSILKNGGNGNNSSNPPSGATTPAEGRSARPSPQPSPRGGVASRRSSFASSHHTASDYEDVFASFSGLNISGAASSTGGSNGSSSAAARRPVNESRAAAAEREYQDRLRNRFSMPPRRYTAGNSFKRRTEIWYPDEGRYRFM